MEEQFKANSENKTDQLTNQRVTTFKKAINSMIATSKAAYVRSDSKTARDRNRVYTKEDIIRIVECGDAVERAALSEHFFSVSGLYKRIIIHYATFLSFNLSFLVLT